MAPNSAAAAKSLSVACCLGLVLAVLPGVYRGELFAWHPLFMGVGLLGFMTEGLLAAVAFRPLEGGARVAAIQNHGLIQAASTLSAGLGFYAIWRNKVMAARARRAAAARTRRRPARPAPPPPHPTHPIRC